MAVVVERGIRDVLDLGLVEVSVALELPGELLVLFDAL